MTTSPENSRIIVCDIDDVELVEVHVPQCHLILWNDDTSTYQTVLRVLMDVLGYTKSRAVEKIVSIEVLGKGIVFTGSVELCELRQEQFGNAQLTTTIESV